MLREVSPAQSERTVPAAKTKRIYYGWYIIAVAMVGAFLCGGMTSQVFFSVILSRHQRPRLERTESPERLPLAP
jgi:hypothetical protein